MCDIKIAYELLSNDLFYISFRFYATNEDMPILYDADLQHLGNSTIHATLSISQAGYQDVGIYECYARILSVDTFMMNQPPSDDLDVYTVARNITLNITTSGMCCVVKTACVHVKGNYKPCICIHPAQT